MKTALHTLLYEGLLYSRTYCHSSPDPELLSPAEQILLRVRKILPPPYCSPERLKAQGAPPRLLPAPAEPASRRCLPPGSMIPPRLYLDPQAVPEDPSVLLQAEPELSDRQAASVPAEASASAPFPD